MTLPDDTTELLTACDAEEPSWQLVQTSFDPALEAKQETLFAQADGALGLRGGLEEWASPSDGAFLAELYERTAISYHERHPGFAATTDTRVPVADGKRIAVLIEDEQVDPTRGTIRNFERRFNFRTGALSHRLVWEAPSGRVVEIRSERVLSFAAPGSLAIRFSAAPVNFTGRVTLISAIATARAVEPQGDDPRIGVELAGGGLRLLDTVLDAEAPGLIQETRHSRIAVACRQCHRMLSDGVEATPPIATPQGVSQSFQATRAPGEAIALEKFVSYAWQASGAEGVAEASRALFDRSGAAVLRLRDAGFDAIAAGQAACFARFWADAAVEIAGDDPVQQALRFNLFHVFQSTGRGGRASTAAKGLTGEGYEGHYFWDTEAFVAPMLVFTAPELVRGMLEYRYRTLDRARAHAREMGHGKGALFPWRTISGDECSAHYPSGSAQYHINAAIAYAVRLYDAGTADDDFLTEMGAELLFETARIWLEIGFFNPRRDGAFCIARVTGPDEYTALVDNNYYTNAMAQQHLRCAAAVWDRLAAEAPHAQAAIATRLDLGAAEIAEWRRAAAAMYLPCDPALGIHAQDDGFLDRPSWPHPHDAEGPLLLRYHPLTLYRYQLCKQADLILALVLAGEEIDAAAKRRDFDYYEPITVHDSTLSPNTFSILASEVGYADKAYSYFLENARVDLDDNHGNVRHGAHMAAMAGSWLSLAWGFAGLRWQGPELRFTPRLPEAWQRYAFGLVWRGRRLKVTVDRTGVRYALDAGPDVTILHHGRELVLTGGEAVDEKFE